MLLVALSNISLVSSTQHQITRLPRLASETYADLVIRCNARYLQTAYTNNTYSYLFAVPPSLHESDVPYVFYDTQDILPSVNATVTHTLQRYVTNLAKTGDPNSADIPYFPAYGTGAVHNLSLTYLVRRWMMDRIAL